MQHNVPQIGAQANVEPSPAFPARFSMPLAALHFGAVVEFITASLDHAGELARAEAGPATMQAYITTGREALDAARRIAGDAEILTDAQTVRKAGEHVAAALGAMIELGRLVGQALAVADPVNNRLAGRVVLLERRTSGRGRYRVA